MPKSHDDPDEVDRIDYARMAREALEREARKRHKAAESTNPPPPYRERQASLVDVHLEAVGPRAGHLKSIIGAIATVVAILVGAGVWVQSRPSKEYVDAAEKRAIAAADEKNAQIQRLAETTVRIEQQVKDMRESDDKRWDKLDKILERQFGQSTAATPPPSFGPAAKARGKQ